MVRTATGYNRKEWGKTFVIRLHQTVLYFRTYRYHEYIERFTLLLSFYIWKSLSKGVYEAVFDEMWYMKISKSELLMTR